MAENERWLPIPGFPGYEVSDFGRVQSYWVRGCHPARMEKTPQGMIKMHVENTGRGSYVFVTLFRDGEHHQRRSVDRLIALTFGEEKKKVVAEDRDKKREEMDAKLASMGLL